ncbi:MAG TPA: glycerophosphodiester phosphodiesterase [Burkholderiales bacterium]
MAAPALNLDVQGHRGARGLLPENTLPAFSRALEIGVTTLELDCGVTKDGIVVVSHDPALNPDLTRDAHAVWIANSGPAIWHLSYDELQRYDVGRLKAGTAYAQRFPQQHAVDGTRIPRLADVFALVQRSGNSTVRFNIETKISPLRPAETAEPAFFVSALLRVIRDAGMEQRVTVQSFDWRTLQIVQKEAPAIPTVYLSAEGTPPDNIERAFGSSPWGAGFHVSRFGGSIPRTIKAAGGAVWSPYHNDLTREALNEAHALGLKVVPWTVNAQSDMRRLIEWGVDGIISDYPDLLLTLARPVHR